MRRNGVALLVTAGALGVLASLAVAFVTLSRLERRSAQQRSFQTLALLLARSGIEDAVARLSAGQEAALPANAFAGEDFDRSGTLNGSEGPAEAFKPGTLNVLDCPARAALRPSFYARKAGALDPDGNPLPRLTTVEGRDRGWSGTTGAVGRDYALKVEDESGKLNVNGGLLDAQDRDLDGIPDHRDTRIRPAAAPDALTGVGWNDQLCRILNLLGAFPSVSVPNLGTQAILLRPLGGWRSIRDLQTALGTPRDLSPHLTVSSWSDPAVVRPRGYPNQLGVDAQAEVKNTRQPLAPELRGRSPVNLNAAPREVLCSLVDGLEARSWFNELSPKSDTLAGMKASLVAAQFLDFREGKDPGGIFAAAGLTPGPFRTWSQFSAFADALVPFPISGMESLPYCGGNLCGADLLKANFDPNTRLNKELPDDVLWRWIDKSDLISWSTEGSLGPTGSFRISATGRVRDEAGRILAEATLSQGTELFRLLRQTSQKDFVAGRTLSSGPSWLSLASPPWEPESLGSGASAVWWAGAPPPSGLSAVTYPCMPPAFPNLAADFDGRVGLATLETPEADAPGGVLRWLHHFDDAWNADFTLAGAVPGLQTSLALELQTSLAQSTWPAMVGVQPATLYPDGCHIQKDRAPGFRVDNVFPNSLKIGDPAPSNHGVISFWAKELQSPSWVQFAFSSLNGIPAASQFLLIGINGCEFGAFVENNPSFYTQRVCKRFFGGYNDAKAPGARWRLLTTHFDTDNSAGNLDIQLSVLGFEPQGATDHTLYTAPFNPANGQNLFVNGRCFYLGGQANNKTTEDFQGNLVVDEFAILDFGDVQATALANASAWANTRYQDGRYYKENDAFFLSGQFTPADAPVRLLRADWTAVLPSDPRKRILLSKSSAFPNPPPTGTPTPLDPTLSGSTFTVDLMDATGGTVLARLTPWTPLGHVLPGFRYRVNFLSTPDWTASERASQPVLESPWLEDITFAFQPAGGPRPLSWEP